MGCFVCLRNYSPKKVLFGGVIGILEYFTGGGP